MNASTPALLPHQIAARGMGETRSPTNADSSRSRCQLRPRARTDENTTASQRAPGATRVVVCGPVAKATLARIATSAAKKAAVVTISRVAASIRRSLRKTARDPFQNPSAERRARGWVASRTCGEGAAPGWGILVGSDIERSREGSGRAWRGESEGDERAMSEACGAYWG